MGQGTVAQMVANNEQMTYMPAGGTELDMPYRGGDPIPLPDPNRLTGGRRKSRSKKKSRRHAHTKKSSMLKYRKRSRKA